MADAREDIGIDGTYFCESLLDGEEEGGDGDLLVDGCVLEGFGD